MNTGYPFDGKRYEMASQCQRAWGTELVEELHLNGDESILDLGCGTGLLTRELAKRVPYGHVVGIDNSPSMLEAAQRNKTANMELKLININEMVFDGEFDIVFSNAALHWIPDHGKLLKRIYNALKLGGFMRVQFGADGNVSTFIEVVKAVMRHPAFVPWFEDFQWPWYMPKPEDYEILLSRTEFRTYRVWEENKDRYFTDPESLVRMVEEAGLVPFLAVLPDEEKQSFRNVVIERLLDRTKRSDGRYFETFRRINVHAEK
jgi:trans-aconitate methyltransferase